MASSRSRVLLVDDDPAVRKVLGALLEQAQIPAEAMASAEEALTALAERPFEVVVTDLRMQAMSGMELLAKITARWPGLPVIMLTAHGTIELAVEAMKAGAADFMVKPFDREEIVYVVKKALQKADRLSESAAIADGASGDLLGQSPAMREVSALVRKAAPGTATVLLRGESGTGKEVVARLLHQESERASKPFVKVHCASLPDTLLESELFGYEKGAFTGAASRKPGRFELAHTGTLFLDEIGDIPLVMQVKLLRVLQERTIERLGGTQSVKVDVRLLAATHRDLETMVAKGEFREDLFYRLNVVPIRLPPLRARLGDVPLLATHFAREFAVLHKKPSFALDARALTHLAGYSWPGNVRQLQNFVERLIVLSDGPVLGAGDVMRELSREGVQESGVDRKDAKLDTQRREVERTAVRTALEKAGNNRSVAARLLGVSRRTLYYKLEEYGLL